MWFSNQIKGNLEITLYFSFLTFAKLNLVKLGYLLLKLLVYNLTKIGKF